MNATIFRGLLDQYQGRYFQWLGRIRHDRLSVVHGRQLQRNGELKEAFGRFQASPRATIHPELHSARR